MQVVNNYSFDLYGSETLDKQIDDIKKHKDYSFVVGYHLIAEQQKKKKEKTLKMQKDPDMPYLLKINQVKKIIKEDIPWNKLISEYCIDYRKLEVKVSWKIGAVVGDNIKKVIKLFIDACNELKLKIDICSNSPYTYQCLYVSEKCFDVLTDVHT